MSNTVDTVDFGNKKEYANQAALDMFMSMSMADVPICIRRQIVSSVEAKEILRSLFGMSQQKAKILYETFCLERGIETDDHVTVQKKDRRTCDKCQFSTHCLHHMVSVDEIATEQSVLYYLANLLYKKTYGILDEEDFNVLETIIKYKEKIDLVIDAGSETDAELINVTDEVYLPLLNRLLGDELTIYFDLPDHPENDFSLADELDSSQDTGKVKGRKTVKKKKPDKPDQNVPSKKLSDYSLIDFVFIQLREPIYNHVGKIAEPIWKNILENLLVEKKNAHQLYLLSMDELVVANTSYKPTDLSSAKKIETLDQITSLEKHPIILSLYYDKKAALYLKLENALNLDDEAVYLKVMHGDSHFTDQYNYFMENGKVAKYCNLQTGFILFALSFMVNPIGMKQLSVFTTNNKADYNKNCAYSKNLYNLGFLSALSYHSFIDRVGETTIFSPSIISITGNNEIMFNDLTQDPSMASSETGAEIIFDENVVYFLLEEMKNRDLKTKYKDMTITYFTPNTIKFLCSASGLDTAVDIITMVIGVVSKNRNITFNYSIKFIEVEKEPLDVSETDESVSN